jgi:hypothetical protein
MTSTPWDEWAGVGKGHLTGYARRLVALAGSSWSFDVASARLKEFCGLSISDQTIRRETDAAGQEAVQWQEASPRAIEPFQKAEGEGEFYTDGTCINTREGWREIRAGAFAKRRPGPAADLAQWRKRELPAPTSRIAFCGLQDCDTFGARWKPMAERLGYHEGLDLSVLGDGAKWIWNQVGVHWPRSECVIDVFHVSEHLHDCGRSLHGEHTDAARQWADQRVDALATTNPVAVVKQLDVEKAAASEKDGQAIDEVLGYLKANLDGLWYRNRLLRGLPIGSGLIEGVCKTVLGRRLKCNGARWRPERAEHVGALCCLLYGDQWAAFWN